MSDNIEKFEAINNKMNRITKELMKNVDLSEEMLTSTEEMSEILGSLGNPKSPAIIDMDDHEDEDRPLTAMEIASNVIDVDLMREDFGYMRSNLRELTENSKRVLESVTEELILAEGDSRAALILAFSELNKAQMEGIKLFMQSYKEVSSILVNFSKVHKDTQATGKNGNTYTTNVVNIEASQGGFSAADIVARMRADPDS